MFNYLCGHNAVPGNPVNGVKRPGANANESSTPALGDFQVRKLLDALPEDTLKGVRVVPFSPPCSITGYAARSSAACACAIYTTVRA